MGLDLGQKRTELRPHDSSLHSASLADDSLTSVLVCACDLSHCCGHFAHALCHQRTLIGPEGPRDNDDAQDHFIGFRAGGCRGHAQDQDRDARRTAAPGSGDRHQPPAISEGRAGVALSGP